MTSRSLPRNEDRAPDVPPRAVAAEDGRERAGRAAHQELPQSRRPPLRGEERPALRPRRGPRQARTPAFSVPSMRRADLAQRAGARPPTSVVNLIFVLANHAAVRVCAPCNPPRTINLTHTASRKRAL